MSNKKKNAQKIYKSRYTDKLITGAQKAAELVCENIARKAGKELPMQFWNNPAWKNIYFSQLYLANGLIRLWGARPVLRALNTPDGQKILSLSWESTLDPIIRREAKKLEKIEEEKEEILGPTVNPLQKPKVFSKKTLFRDLDG